MWDSPKEETGETSEKVRDTDLIPGRERRQDHFGQGDALDNLIRVCYVVYVLIANRPPGSAFALDT